MRSQRLPQTLLPLLLLAAVAASPAPAALPQGVVAEQMTPAGVVLVPAVSWDSARLVVTGPGELQVEQRFEAGSTIQFAGIGVEGAPLADGIYRYELRLAPPVADASATGHRVWGEFRVRDGIPQSVPLPADETEEGAQSFPGEPARDEKESVPGLEQKTVENHFSRDLGTVAELCAGCSSSFEPDDEPLTLIGSEPGIRFQDTEESPSRLWEVDVTTTDRLVIEDSDGTDIFNIEAGGPANSLYIDQFGRVGLGTTSPMGNLHFLDGAPVFRLEQDTSGGRLANSWELAFSIGGALFIRDSYTNHKPFYIDADSPDGTLTIQSDGKVGIGTYDPAAKLDVEGAAIIRGDVSLGSSRTLKHSIEPVGGSDVLRALRDLPVYSWRYKDDPTQATHVGPMAEDFHGLFGLGRDDKHLSPADSSGLALVAIKEVDRRLNGEVHKLRRVTRELEARNVQLAAENTELRERLDLLERRLEELTSALRQSD